MPVIVTALLIVSQGRITIPLLSKRNNRDDTGDLKIADPSVGVVSGVGKVRRPGGDISGFTSTFAPGELCDRGPVAPPLSVFSSVKWP